MAPQTFKVILPPLCPRRFPKRSSSVSRKPPRQPKTDVADPAHIGDLKVDMRRIRHICGRETNRQMQVPELFENRYYNNRKNRNR